MLDTCSDCAGFLPKAAGACPHCGSSRGLWRAARKSAQLAGAGAMMVTLMACYGGPVDETPQGNACFDAVQLDDEEAQATGTTRTAGVGSLHGSCGPATSQSIYRFTTSRGGNKPGTLTVTWRADSEVAVYVYNYCSTGKELACEPAASSGKLELHTNHYSSYLIAVAASSATEHDIEVSFTPCADDDKDCAALAEN